MLKLSLQEKESMVNIRYVSCNIIFPRVHTILFYWWKVRGIRYLSPASVQSSIQTTCWTVSPQAGTAFRTLPSGILICTWYNSVCTHRKNKTRTQTIWKYIISKVQTSDLMSLQKPFSFFLKKKIWRTSALSVGPLIPLLWTSGDIFPGFQSQDGSPCLHAL